MRRFACIFAVMAVAACGAFAQSSGGLAGVADAHGFTPVRQVAAIGTAKQVLGRDWPVFAFVGYDVKGSEGAAGFAAVQHLQARGSNVWLDFGPAAAFRNQRPVRVGLYLGFGWSF